MTPAGAKRDRRALLRFIVATMLVALLYVGLQEAELAIFGRFLDSGSVPTWMLTGDAQQDEARRVAEASAAREASLTTQHRCAALELGYHLGYTAEAIGVVAGVDASLQAQMKPVLSPHEQRSKELAALLGISEAAPLAIRTANDLIRLAHRIEADENGVAQRIEAATTLRHRHLYLIGAHAGLVSAQLDTAAVRGGTYAAAPSLQIARHASAAGVSRKWWGPLVEFSTSGEEPNAVAEKYRSSIAALIQALENERTIDDGSGN
jgi:hypothetical protein